MTAADNAKRAQTAETFRSLLREPDTPEGTKAKIRQQLAEWGEPSDVTASAIRRFGQVQSEPKETPREIIRRETMKGVVAARPKSPFALPEGTTVDESKMGVTAWERLLLKNLAANPDAAARWLQSKGYETYLYEPGEGGTEGPTSVLGVQAPATKMRIAVRKPGETDFKVVDPAGFDIYDLTDLFGDLVFGALTQAGMKAGQRAGALLGAPGGPVGVATGGAAGGMAGGAAAGAAGEVARQGLGNMITTLTGQPKMNPTLSVPDVEAQALGGAAAFPMTKAMEFGGRVAAKGAAAAGLGAKRIVLSGIATLGKWSPEQLAEAIKNRVILLKHFDSRMMASSLAQRTMQFLTELDESKTLEYQTAQQLLQKGSGEVHIKPILQAIRDEVTSPFHEMPVPPTKFMGIPVSGNPPLRPLRTTVKIPSGKTGHFGLEAAENDRVRQMLVEEAGKLARNAGMDSVEEAIHKDATIPVAMAESLKRLYAEQASYAVSSLEKDAAKEAAHGFLADRLRDGVRESIPDPVIRKQYGDLMTQAGKKLGLAKEFQKALIAKGAEEIEPEAGGAEEIVQAANRPEAFFRTYLNKGARSGQKSLVREFGRLWSPELEVAGLGSFEDQARLASTVAAAGAEDSAAFGGEPGIHVGFAHFSFGGKPMGMLLGTSLGGGIGYLMGGPEGAIKGGAIGGGIGYYMASPRGSINSAAALKKMIDTGTKVAEFPGRLTEGDTFRPTLKSPFGIVPAGTEVPIRVPTPALAGMTASRTTGAGTSTLERDQEATRKLVASDSEAMAALSKIASDVRADMVKNPNLTQEDAVAEFVKRKDEWLARRKMSMAGGPTPTPFPAPTATPPPAGPPR